MTKNRISIINDTKKLYYSSSTIPNLLGQVMYDMYEWGDFFVRVGVSDAASAGPTPCSSLLESTSYPDGEFYNLYNGSRNN